MAASELKDGKENQKFNCAIESQCMGKVDEYEEYEKFALL